MTAARDRWPASAWCRAHGAGLSASPLRGQLHRGALAMLFSRFTEYLTGVMTNR